MIALRMNHVPTVALIAVFVVGSSATLSQTFVTSPQPVNTDAPTDGIWDRWPALSVNPLGDFLVVWDRATLPGPGYGQIMTARTTDQGGTWSAPFGIGTTVVQASDPVFGHPVIATDSGGTAVVAWHHGEYYIDPGMPPYMPPFAISGGNIRTARSSNGGQSWGPENSLTTNAISWSDDLSPSIATDGVDCWIIAWDSDDDLAGTIGVDRDILFARSTNDGQSWVTQILNSDAQGESFVDRNVEIATDGSGNWIAAWQRDGAVAVARSQDNGVSWSSPQIVTASCSGFELATGNGVWIVAFRFHLGSPFFGPFVIHAVRSMDGGNTWLPPQSICTWSPGTFGSQLGLTMATDGCGTWLTTWHRTTPPSPSFLLASRSYDDGASWSSPAQPTLNPLSNDLDPSSLSDDSGNWLLLWVSQNDLGGTIESDFDILFTRGVGPSPTASLSLTATNPTPTSYLIDLTATGFTPGNQYFTCFTYEMGEHPAGPWFGIDPLYDELAIQAATLAPPFNGLLDAAGSSALSWSWWGTPGPLGITLYAVTIEHVAGNILRASPPTAATL